MGGAISFIIILQKVYPYSFVLFCVYHISQLKRKHVGHAWNDSHIFGRKGNEIREVCTRYICVCNTTFHELGSEYMGFHLLLSITGCLKYFKSKLKLKEGNVEKKMDAFVPVFISSIIVKIFIQ